MTTTKTRTGGVNTPLQPDVVDDGPDVYLGASEVAEVLGMHRSHAWRLMRSGVIPDVVDLSSDGERATLRVRRSALRAWIDSRAL